MNKLMEIFKAGKHVAEDGKTYEFSEADVAAIAKGYDPAKSEAPLVVGHPKTNAPAYGWVKELASVGGVLVAAPQQVEPAFAEMVNAGRFKKRSASFYGPEHPKNPTPGAWYLRHVGFLGAQPPAVAGLRDVQFAEQEEGTVNFADWSDVDNASLWRRLRDWMIGKFGIDEADKIVPDYLVNSLQTDAAVELAKGPDVASYAEVPAQVVEVISERERKVKEKEDALAAREARFAEREQALSTQAAATARAGCADFVEALVAAGKVLPRDKEPLVIYLTSSGDSTVIEFSEGEEKKTAKPSEWLRQFLERLPKQVDFSEVAARETSDAAVVNFSAPPGYSVDTGRLELHNKALAYQREHPNTSYEAALSAVGK